jgi:hypothetical protein
MPLTQEGQLASYWESAAAEHYRERRAHRRLRRKLVECNALHLHVHDRLVHWRWSPQQIAFRLKRMTPHPYPGLVRRETIDAPI